MLNLIKLKMGDKMERREILTEQSQRNYGIDLLRILSMMMVVMLHCLAQGGILRNAEPLSLKYELGWLLEIAAFCAVNCYALISGYVGYGRKVRYSSLFYIVAQVTFYTLVITVVFKIAAPGTVGMFALLKALFPIAYEEYWYITAYFCLFFFLPFLNQALETASRQTLQKLIFAQIFVLCVLPTLYQMDVPRIKWGYSFVWLGFLYLIGAYIKEYGAFQQIGAAKAGSGYLLCVLFTWGSRWGVEAVTTQIFGTPKLEDYLIQYNSPAILFCSVCLLLCFSKVKLGKAMMCFIGFFAPAAFGVYIIHCHPLVFQYVIKDLCTGYLQFDLWMMFCALVGTVLAIWLVCSLIEKMRIFLFDLLRIKVLCSWLEEKIRFWLRCAAKYVECNRQT